MALAIPENIRQFLRVMGRQGGRTRAQRYSKEQLAAWGRLGGRPRKAGARKRLARLALTDRALCINLRDADVQVDVKFSKDYRE